MNEDVINLLHESMALSTQAIEKQGHAITLLQNSEEEVEEGAFTYVDEDLPQAIADAEDNDILVVSPTCITQQDLIIDKTLHIIGASITGFIDVQASDVHLTGCSITGPNPVGSLITTGDGLLVQGCRLVGSPEGQHRGIHVRSSDVVITDTSITNIWKDGQEGQAIAGWDGVNHLIVERCWLEAAGENFMLGGEDSSSEDTMPFDVIVRDCVLTKPMQWMNRGYVVKNLFELKTIRKFLMERCVLEYSWVEGQTGFAMVINVRNQSGNAPWSTIEDVIIRDCTVRHMAAGIQFLGTDYTHPSGLMTRVLIENNVFEDISPTWGNNQRCLQFSHGGEDIQFRGNTFSGTSINSFMTFEGQPMVRFAVTNNTFPEGYYGIKADDTAIGTPTLEKYAPECEWTGNTVVRTEPNNYPYPEGTTIVT